MYFIVNAVLVRIKLMIITRISGNCMKRQDTQTQNEKIFSHLLIRGNSRRLM